jgi:hypothetical protein
MLKPNALPVLGKVMKNAYAAKANIGYNGTLA